MLPRFFTRPYRRWLLTGALWAVLAAQSLALLHGIAHPSAGSRGDGPGWRSGEAPGWVAQAFAGHDHGSLSCQLLDQLLHDGLPGVPAAMPLPLLPALVAVAEPAGRLFAVVVAGYHARAPPLLI